MAIWMNLSQDIVTEILLKLPVKSLIRFKCVCRSWHVLIQSPLFIDLHLKLAKDGEHIFTYQFTREDNKPFLLFHSKDELLSVVAHYQEHVPGDDLNYMFCLGSCNGIFCFTAFNMNVIILFNLALHQSRQVYANSINGPTGFEHNTKGFGFGYDPTIDDYKIFRIINIWPEEEVYYNNTYPEIPDIDYKIEIYSLRTKTWRQLDGISKDVAFLPYSNIFFFFKGCFHCVDALGSGIMSFNMATEIFLNIPFPKGKGSPKSEKTTDPFILDSCLAFISYTAHEKMRVEVDQFFDIWVMKEYGVEESWTKCYHVGPLSNIKSPIISLNQTNSLCFETIDEQFILYDLNTEQVQKYNVIEGFNDKESLISINWY